MKKIINLLVLIWLILMSFLTFNKETNANGEKPAFSTYEDKLFAFVMKWEGAFQSKAFCDSYYKTKYWMQRRSANDCLYWSIGFGTKYYRGERITYNEAIKRKKADLMYRDSFITSTCLTTSQRIRVVDFLYQHGLYSSWVKWKANNCKTSSLFWTFAGWRDFYRGRRAYWMVRREQSRINLFYKK